MSPAILAASKKSAKPQPAMPGGFAGQILRVDLTKRRCWAEPWGPEEMRDQLGGIGLGRASSTTRRAGEGQLSWDHPDNRLILATGPLAGLPVWGTGGLTVVTRGALTGGATSTQANGFFGANLKYSGYDAIVIQGQATSWVYLYINDDRVELRDAAHLVGKDTWETQQALSAEHGLARPPAVASTPSAPRARTWCASRRSRATTATSPPRTAAAP